VCSRVCGPETGVARVFEKTTKVMVFVVHLIESLVFWSASPWAAYGYEGGDDGRCRAAG
jgi:hypothetical protein